MLTNLANFQSHRDRKCSSFRHMPLRRIRGYFLYGYAQCINQPSLAKRAQRVSIGGYRAFPEKRYMQANERSSCADCLACMEQPYKPPIGQLFQSCLDS